MGFPKITDEQPQPKFKADEPRICRHLYTHRYDPNTPLEETLQTLVDIVRQGKALYIGISKYPKDKAELAYKYLEERDVHCLLYQGKYNLFNREPEEEGILRQAKENGTGFIAFSPLAQGLLTNRYLNGIPDDSRIAKRRFLKKEALTDEVLKKIKALNELAIRRGQTLAEMALAWILKDDLVTSVIIGASSVGQLADNLKAIDNTAFSAEELKKHLSDCKIVANTLVCYERDYLKMKIEIVFLI